MFKIVCSTYTLKLNCLRYYTSDISTFCTPQGATWLSKEADKFKDLEFAALLCYFLPQIEQVE